MSNYLAHDLTVDELNRVFRLIQGDISHAKGSTSAAPTQTVLGSPSVASLTANPSTPSTGAGTVTTISVATANGFQGSVATPTTTPVITIQTSLSSGLIKSNGSGSFVLASAGTDFITPSTGTFTSDIDINVAGKGLKVAEGSNAKQGVATLILGTATVANTSVTATSRVFLTRQGLNASTTLGELAVNSRIAGTSFTITAYIPTTALVSTGDVSTIAYEIIEPG